MNALKFTGVVICFGLLAACGDDEQEGPAPGDDAAVDATVDAGAEAAVPPVDSQVPGPPLDARVDAATLDAEVDAEVDAGQYVEVLVNLTTAAEAPPCASAGPNARGQAKVLLPKNYSGLLINDVTWENLSSPVTSAHVHYAAAGVSGPIALTFTGVTLPISEGFGGPNYFAAAGLPTSFDSFLEELKAGKTYLNFHTQACPNGELRGQIVLP
ncbi:MAG: CHRD domain-containing protein [Polyangiales bacterium]